MAIGMSPEEFWHGDPRFAKAYREAEKIRRDNRYMAEWRTGIYMYEALLSASNAFREVSKGIDHKYPQSPLFSTDPQKEETEEDKSRAAMEKNKANFKALAERINQRLREKQEAEKEEGDK